MNKTCVLLKPDALTRGVVGEILVRFERKGFRMVACKMMNMNEVLLKEHYSHVAHEPFFEELSLYMQMAPVLALVIEGQNVVDIVRAMTGKNMFEAGTIRGDYATSFQRNLIHSSDSNENAQVEISRFFTKEEIFSF